MSYGTALRLWRDAAGTAWNDHTHHALVEQMADGPLRRAAYLFLVHFPCAWTLAVTKAKTLDEMHACREGGALIDLTVARRLGPTTETSPRWRRLCTRLQTATRLEVDSWAMGLSG
ncbi:hypothetical protein [Primorskyibacter flagellatus]|uniref:Uncharacterized protein n=1 Tax=Primorskyibacter flagellatus TaxID=1387277 RepID=A0A1W2DNF0_9RHOB|nr:hypothetical protein [Primorskyibacter flagellatus]SMC98937.1 hypothetical protein SAMN06295998_11620 [Primorskyibacter flagellatus]